MVGRPAGLRDVTATRRIQARIDRAERGTSATAGPVGEGVSEMRIHFGAPGTASTAIKLKKWDSAEHLKTDEDIARCWEACLEEGGDDPAFITEAWIAKRRC